MKIKPSDVVFGGLITILLIALYGIYVPRWISSDSEQLVKFGFLTIGGGVISALAFAVHFYNKWSDGQ